MSEFNSLIGKYFVEYDASDGEVTGVYLVKEAFADGYLMINKFDAKTSPLSLTEGLPHLVYLKNILSNYDCIILDNPNDVILVAAKLKKIEEVHVASRKFLLSELLPKNIALGSNDDKSDPAVGD